MRDINRTVESVRPHNELSFCGIYPYHFGEFRELPTVSISALIGELEEPYFPRYCAECIDRVCVDGEF